MRVHPHCWVGSVRRVARNAKRSPLRAREPCFYSKLVSRRNTCWQALETSCYRICIPPLLGSESRRIFHICLPGLRRAASCVGKRGLAEHEVRRAAVESARGGKIWQNFQSLSLGNLSSARSRLHRSRALQVFCAAPFFHTFGSNFVF